MLDVNRREIETLITLQRKLRERLEHTWEIEEEHNSTRTRGHEYTAEMVQQTVNEECDMEFANNLMDNVIDALYSCIERDKTQTVMFIDSKDEYEK